MNVLFDGRASYILSWSAKFLFVCNVVFIACLAAADCNAQNLNGWNEVYNGERGITIMKNCGDSRADDCPVIRAFYKLPTEEFNKVFFDHVISDYVQRLSKLGHDNIEYNVEDLSNTFSARVLSHRDSIQYNTIIAVNNKDIRYYEYSAPQHLFNYYQDDFDGFWREHSRTEIVVMQEEAAEVKNKN